MIKLQYQTNSSLSFLFYLFEFKDNFREIFFNESIISY